MNHRFILALIFAMQLLSGFAVEAQSTHHDHGSLALPNRLAFMTGHVEAGLALYRAGEPAMAAPHLMHPVSETHAAERQGLDQLGFNGELFVFVSKSLEEGRPAAEIEPQILAAEANLAMLAKKAGGDSVDVINFLLDTVLKEYAVGVPAGSISDLGDYQDAFGFTTVAIDRASGLDRPNLTAQLNALLMLWPATGPVPSESPATLEQVRQQVERVRAAM